MDSIPGSGTSLEEETATYSIFMAGESHGQRRLVIYSPWVHKDVDMRVQQHIMDERGPHPQGYFHFGRKILVPVTLNTKEKTPNAGYSDPGVGQSMTFGTRAAFWFLQVFLRQHFTLLYITLPWTSATLISKHTPVREGPAPCNDCT